MSNPEPLCCGTPMVHNSFTGEYECADAYFGLLDDGVIGESATLIVDFESLNERDLDRYEHWKASRVPDAALAAERAGGVSRGSASV